MQQPLTSLRNVHTCPEPATLSIDGHAPHGLAGTDPALTAHACQGHAQAAAEEWFRGLRTTVREGGLLPTCGAVLEWREPDAVLQAHADLWLGPLTGVWPADHDGDWAATVTEARDRLAAVLHTVGGKGFEQAVFALDQAVFAAQDLGTAEQPGGHTKGHVLVALAIAETLTAQARQHNLQHGPTLQETAAALQAAIDATTTATRSES